MARTPDDRTTEPRIDPAREEVRRVDTVDDATLRPNARTTTTTTAAQSNKGGRTLWLVLAAVVALLVVFWLFSGGLGTGTAVNDNTEVAPGAAVDGAVTTTDPAVTGTVAPATVDTTAPADVETTPPAGVETTPPADVETDAPAAVVTPESAEGTTTAPSN